MKDYDQELEKLLRKYNITTSLLGSTYIDHLMIKKCKDLVVKKQRLAIWSAGDYNTRWGKCPHVIEIFQIFPNIKSEIVCIIDDRKAPQGTHFEGIAVRDPDHLSGEIDTVIFMSAFLEKENISILKEKYPQYRWVDICDNFEKLPLKDFQLFNHWYYNLFKYQLDLYVLRKKYEKQNPENMSMLLKELIIKYLYKRDFLYAEKYIKEYIENQFPEYLKMNSFLLELDKLLEEMRSVLNSRECKDIGLFIIDSWRSKDFFNEAHIEGNTHKYMPFLHNLSKGSMTFTNAFSVSSFTLLSMQALLNGKLPFVGDMHKQPKFKFENSELLKHFYNKGYKLYHFGGKPFFEENSMVTYKKMESRLNEPASNVLWNYLCELVNNINKPNFSIVHLCGEIHQPNLCSYIEELGSVKKYTDIYMDGTDEQNIQVIEETVTRHKDGMKNIDEQLLFYNKFLPNDMTQVIFGDHGQALGEHGHHGGFFNWYDEIMHVPLIIHSQDIQDKQVDSLFSFKDFSRIFIELFENKNFQEQSNEYVEFQRDPVYNQEFISNEKLVETIGRKFFRAFKVVRSINEKYVVYDDDKEEYYLLPDEVTNRIGEVKYKERIKILSEKAGRNKFPDFYHIDKYSKPK